jgi:nicotine blue oxidoreductase
VWARAAATALGDEGARGLLREAPELVTEVECGDIADASDLDTPEALRRWLSSAHPPPPGGATRP